MLEFLVMNGRDLARAVTLVIPEPWDRNAQLSKERRYYDAYQSMLMEPWDGPAAIAFSDGTVMGAALDRNGLRPARYYVTRDDRLILASEVGAIDMDSSAILQAGCLGPGEMLLVDPVQGRVIYNDELRNGYAVQKPFGTWLSTQTVDIANLPLSEAQPKDGSAATPHDEREPLSWRLASHGYHFDDIEEVVRPMAQTGSVPLASMGTDVPPAILSRLPRSFFDYFNELFAQVTNPPIDALRESMVTSNVLYLGNHGNPLEDGRDNCRSIRLDGPVLSQDDFERIRHIDRVGFGAQTFRTVYPQDAGSHALEHALDDLDKRVSEAVAHGTNIIILSDRARAGEAPIPSLLALGSVHNHLIRQGMRMRADIVVETGDAMPPEFTRTSRTSA